MRIVSYASSRGVRAGVLRDGLVVDAWDALGDAGSPRVRELLAQDRIPDLRRVAPGEGEGVRVEDVELRAPVPDPDKIICIGLNYRSHAEEAGIDPPSEPTFFAKFRNALVGPGKEVKLPPASRKVDYEAEVAFVIGRRCSDLSEAEALDCVAGYTLLNDLSARDLQFATPQWMPGKVFDGSAPCGPALVTPDEAGAHDAIAIGLTLNGETMQSAATSDLIFSIPALVSRLSRLMTLEPGDIVSTGTPSGVGSVRTPRVWLKPGDEIAVSSPTLGTLATRIVA
jgi:2-keto-4-pentenoate hydratase/2-oxohepta-3-ene-1,7-dioic acid hydratase in catechol pathway